MTDVRGLQFVNQIKGGHIPNEYIPSVEKGFKEAMKMDRLQDSKLKILKWYSMVLFIRLILMLFRLNLLQSRHSGMPHKAKPVLLEPIMKVEVVTPEEYMGDIVSDLNRRGGILKIWMQSLEPASLRQWFLWQNSSVMLLY